MNYNELQAEHIVKGEVQTFSDSKFNLNSCYVMPFKMDDENGTLYFHEDGYISVEEQKKVDSNEYKTVYGESIPTELYKRIESLIEEVSGKKIDSLKQELSDKTKEAENELDKENSQEAGKDISEIEKIITESAYADYKESFSRLSEKQKVKIKTHEKTLSDYGGVTLSPLTKEAMDIKHAYLNDEIGKDEYDSWVQEHSAQEKQTVKTLTFLGDKSDFRTVLDSGVCRNVSFGSTVIDGNTLEIVIRESAAEKDVRTLIETAENNNVYLNVPSARMLEELFGKDFMQSKLNPVFAESIDDFVITDKQNDYGSVFHFTITVGSNGNGRSVHVDMSGYVKDSENDDFRIVVFADDVSNGEIQGYYFDGNDKEVFVTIPYEVQKMLIEATEGAVIKAETEKIRDSVTWYTKESAITDDGCGLLCFEELGDYNGNKVYANFHAEIVEDYSILPNHDKGRYYLSPVYNMDNDKAYILVPNEKFTDQAIFFDMPHDILERCEKKAAETAVRIKCDSIRESLYDMYKKEWLNENVSPQMQKAAEEKYKEHEEDYDSFDDYIFENGYGSGSLYVCYDEFCEYEFKDEDWLQNHLSADEALFLALNDWKFTYGDAILESNEKIVWADGKVITKEDNKFKTVEAQKIREQDDYSISL